MPKVHYLRRRGGRLSPRVEFPLEFFKQNGRTRGHQCNLVCHLQMLDQEIDRIGDVRNNMILATYYSVSLQSVAAESQVGRQWVDWKRWSVCLAKILPVSSLKVLHNFWGDIDCLPVCTRLGICWRWAWNLEASKSVGLSFRACGFYFFADQFSLSFRFERRSNLAWVLSAVIIKLSSSWLLQLLSSSSHLLQSRSDKSNAC